MTRTTRPTLAAWLLTAFTVAAPANGFVLCARGDGAPNEGASVKVRSACKDNETAVDPGLLGRTTASAIVRTGNTITANGSLSSPANCLQGEIATGGGAITSATGGGLAALRASHPHPDDPGSTPTGWRVAATNLSDTGTITSTTYVVCMTATP